MKLNDNANFFERLLQIIDFYKIKNVNYFAKNHLGYASSEKINRLRKEDNKPSFEILADISNKFEDINLNWLVTGKGNMFINENKQPETLTSIDEFYKQTIQEQKKEIAVLNQEIGGLKEKLASFRLQSSETMRTMLDITIPNIHEAKKEPSITPAKTQQDLIDNVKTNKIQ